MTLIKVQVSLKGIYSLLVVMFFISGSLWAQETDSRKTEADIKIEDRFVAARFLAIAGKKAEAIKLLDTLRRVGPPSAAVLFELAKLHHEAKNINQTESMLRAAIKLEPDNYWIRKYESDFSVELGRYDDALRSLKHLLTVYPEKEALYDEAVQLSIKKNDLTAALAILDEKEVKTGWSERTVLKKAEIYDNAGRIDEAVRTLQTLVDKYPGEKRYLRIIANMLHSNDKVAEAEPYLQKILAIDPDDQDARLGLTILKGKAGSRQDFFAGLYPMISNPDAPIDLKIKELLPFVQQHADSGDTILGKQLIDLCDKLVIAHPNEAKAHAIYADVLKNNDENTAAIRQYEKTLKLNNKNFMVWEQLMICQEKTGNFEDLGKTATGAMDYFPNQAISYYFAARSFIQKNEIKQAQSLLEEASMISAGSPFINSKISYANALIEFGKKNLQAALQYAEKALEASGGKNAEAMELRGDIHMEKGDLREAEKCWRQAIGLGGNKKGLEARIAKLKS